MDFHESDWSKGGLWANTCLITHVEKGRPDWAITKAEKRWTRSKHLPDWSITEPEKRWTSTKLTGRAYVAINHHRPNKLDFSLIPVRSPRQRKDGLGPNTCLITKPEKGGPDWSITKAEKRWTRLKISMITKAEKRWTRPKHLPDHQARKRWTSTKLTGRAYVATSMITDW